MVYQVQSIMRGKKDLGVLEEHRSRFAFAYDLCRLLEPCVERGESPGRDER